MINKIVPYFVMVIVTLTFVLTIIAIVQVADVYEKPAPNRQMIIIGPAKY